MVLSVVWLWSDCHGRATDSGALGRGNFSIDFVV